MYDAESVLQASVTKTASFNSAGYDMPKGTPIAGLVARVYYSAAANASGANTVTYSIEHSDDDTTYYALASGADQVVTLSTTAQSGLVHIPFRTNKKYIRLVTTVAGAGTSPTVTYEAQVGFSKP